MVYKPKKNQHLCVELKERPSKCIILLLLWFFIFYFIYYVIGYIEIYFISQQCQDKGTL